MYVLSLFALVLLESRSFTMRKRGEEIRAKQNNVIEFFFSLKEKITTDNKLKISSKEKVSKLNKKNTKDIL